MNQEDKKNIKVTDDHVNKAIDLWKSRANKGENPPSAKELVVRAFSDESIDARWNCAKQLLGILANNHNINPARSHQIQKGEGRFYVLTEQEEEFVKNHSKNMNWSEIARELFTGKVKKFSPLLAESQAVKKFYMELPAEQRCHASRQFNEALDYSPPTTKWLAVKKINEMVPKADWDTDKLDDKKRRCVDKVIAYLHSPRFQHQICIYQNENDRSLFESTFVRYVYDKDDLTEEEIDQCVDLCIDTITATDNRRRAEALGTILEEQAQEEDAKFRMSIIEALDRLNKEYNDIMKRKNDLINGLKQKRSDRLKQKVQENHALTKLVELWKQEDSRKKMIKLAELEKVNVKTELDRLANLDTMIAEIHGITYEEIR